MATRRAQTGERLHRKANVTPSRLAMTWERVGKYGLRGRREWRKRREGRQQCCHPQTYLDLAKGLFGTDGVKADGLDDVVRLVLGNGHLVGGRIGGQRD